MPPTTKFTHQPLRTDYSGTDMPFVRCNNGGYCILCYFFDMRFGHETEGKWQNISCYSIIPVENTIWIQSMTGYK